MARGTPRQAVQDPLRKKWLPGLLPSQKGPALKQPDPPRSSHERAQASRGPHQGLTCPPEAGSHCEPVAGGLHHVYTTASTCASFRHMHYLTHIHERKPCGERHTRGELLYVTRRTHGGAAAEEVEPNLWLRWN